MPYQWAQSRSDPRSRANRSWSQLRDDKTAHAAVEMADMKGNNADPMAMEGNDGVEIRQGSNSTSSEIRHATTVDPMLGRSNMANEGLQQMEYKVYKRRWFGLVQLVLLNIIVSWNWLTYAPAANTSATFFGTNTSTINWLSTAFLFSYVVASPATHYALYHFGPKTSITVSSTLILIGNWIRYGSTRASTPSFPGVMVGHILIGLSQPFVLAAATQYSNLWFTARGRVGATALVSLANPFGGALGQLIGPLIATEPGKVPDLTLYVAIISSVVSLPGFLVPAKPPTPASKSSAAPQPSVRKQLGYLAGNASFWIIFFTFGVYVGLFNSFSSLLTQFLTPYGLSEEDGGLAGAVLILSGLVVAAVTSPLVDKYKRYLLLIKSFVPVLAICYLAFIWAPPTRGIVAPYVICAFLGASSFSLVPVVLEWAAEVTYPVGPELTSVLFWASGQLLGGVFVIISDALMEGPDADPPFNIHRALIFNAVLALSVVPLVLALGWVGDVEPKRLEADIGFDGGNTEGVVEERL